MGPSVWHWRATFFPYFGKYIEQLKVVYKLILRILAFLSAL